MYLKQRIILSLGNYINSFHLELSLVGFWGFGVLGFWGFGVGLDGQKEKERLLEDGEEWRGRRC